MQTLHVGDNDFKVCDTSHVEGAEGLSQSLRILLVNVLLAAAGGGAFYYIKILKPKQDAAKGNTSLEDFDFDEDDEETEEMESEQEDEDE